MSFGLSFVFGLGRSEPEDCFLSIFIFIFGKIKLGKIEFFLPSIRNKITNYVMHININFSFLKIFFFG